MSAYTVQGEVKLKDGTAIREGSAVIVEWDTMGVGGSYVVKWWPRHGEERTARLSGRSVGRMIAGYVPSDEDLEEWVMDSVCPTPAGDEVEPDGHGPDGCPSWLMLLGLV